MNVYLAAPFFNREQQARLDRIANLMWMLGDPIVYYPSHFMKLEPTSNPLERKRVFDENKKNIDWCNVFICILDDKDTGTLWEMGYAHKAGKEIIAIYVQPVEKVNVMLEMCCFKMFNGIQMFIDYFSGKTKHAQPLETE